MVNVKIYKCFPHIFFALALTVFFFFIFDLQKVGKGQKVQFSQITPFDGKCQNLQMSLTHCFCASSYRLRDITILNFLHPKKVKITECSHIFALALTICEK